MVNLSSAEGARFAALCQEMTDAVKELGPSPLRGKKSERGEGSALGGETGKLESFEELEGRR